MSPPSSVVRFQVDTTIHEVQANQKGRFTCPCSFHLGVKTLYSPQEHFVAHATFVQMATSAKFTACGPFVFLSSDLLETPRMARYGIAINTHYKLVLCLPCKCAVVPCQLKSHLHIQHKTRLEKDDQKDLVKLFSLCHVGLQSLPELPEPLPHRIQGLPVRRAHPCPECLSVGNNHESLKAHMRKMHKGTAYPDADVTTQVHPLHHGSKKNFIRIQDQTESSGTDILSQASDMLLSAQDLPTETPTDPRELCPWLRRMRWQDLVSGKEVKDLMSLVKFPSHGEFPSLSDALETLLLTCSEKFETTPELILQRLKADKVEDSFNVQPFRKLEKHEEQMKKYRLPVLGLLAMLLRDCPVPLTVEIQVAIGSLQSSLVSGDLLVTSERILDVLTMLWQYPWTPLVNHRISDPTVLYVALSSLEASGKFKDVRDVTPVIANVVYVMRLVFLLLINRDSEGMETAYRRYEPFLKEGFESTFNSLRNMQRQATSIVLLTPCLPKVWWVDRKRYRELLYRGTRIRLEQLHALLSELEKRIQQVWENDVLLGLAYLRVDYEVIHDDLANTDVGYSFLSDPRNTCFSDKLILLRAILKDEKLTSRFISFREGGVLRFNVHAGRSWLTKLAELHLLLLLRFYLTGGAPGRGTELVLMLLYNMITYPLRNLVSFGPFIALICTYLKTSSMSGHDKVVPHALDAFTADLLIQELAIARPFAILLAMACYPEEPKICQRYSKHVFVNHTRSFTTDDLTHILQKFTLEFMDIGLGVSDWRHINTAFRRKLCGRLKDLLDEDNEEEAIDALQMNHSLRTENRVYGISQEALRGAPEDILPLFLDASTDWQVLMKMVPGGLGLRYQDALASSFQDHVLAGRISLDVVTSNDTVMEILQRLLEQSDRMERKIDALVAADRSQSLGSQSTSLSSIMPTPTHGMQALKTLRQVLNSPAAEWKTEAQKSAVLHALKRQHDVIAVLPTNAGKSMIAIIPPLLERDMVTVIVLPLRILILDFQRKLQQMAIPFCTFESGQTRINLGTSNIVLVSADRVKWDSWRQAILILHEQRPVSRIIIDEAHIPLLSQGFRHRLCHMSEVRMSLPVQIILLTASGHPELLKAMISDYGIEPEAVVIRAPPNRPELEYVWKPAKDVETMVALLDESVQDSLHGSEDRAIIFVPWKDLGRELAGTMNYPFYHGGGDDEDEDEEVTRKQVALYQNWLRGDPPMIIATSAFGTGNDYPRVRLVVHACAPYEMTNYVQEISRAGRDGEPAECLLLYMSGEKIRSSAHTASGDERDLGGRGAMADSMQNPHSKCIRFRITSYIDPERGVYCSSDPRNRLCSPCTSLQKNSIIKQYHPAPFVQQMDRAKRQRTERLLDQYTYEDVFQKCLDLVTKTCSFCFGHSQDALNPVNHDFSRCQVVDRSRFISWRRGLQYGPGVKVCYHCHVPQGSNDVLHPVFRKNGAAQCRYRDIVAPLVFGLLSHDDLTVQCLQTLPGVLLFTQVVVSPCFFLVSGETSSQESVSEVIWSVSAQQGLRFS